MAIVLSGPQPAGLPKLFFDNVFDAGAPVASSTASGDAANLRDWRPYTWWQPVTLPATVTVDALVARAADYLFIAPGHNLFSSGCTVEVRGSTDDFAASNVLLGSSTPASDDDAVVITFDAALYRCWRLQITGSAAPALAVAAIGSALTLPTYLESGFDPLGRTIVGDTNRNSRGQVLGRVVDFEEWSQTVKLQAVPWSWLRASWLPAWNAALRSRPFGFAWDPDNYPAETRLVTIKADFETPHNVGSLCDLSFKVAAVA